MPIKFFTAGYLALGGGRPSMAKVILMIGAILMLGSNATAQDETVQQHRVGHCAADLRKLCPGIPAGDDNLRTCMREHIRDVSTPCLVALAKFAEVRQSLKGECSAHLRQLCGNVERRAGQFAACLKSAVASRSNTCKDALTRAIPRDRP